MAKYKDILGNIRECEDTIMIGNTHFWFDRISAYSGYPRQGKWIEFSFRNEHPLHLRIAE